MAISLDTSERTSLIKNSRKARYGGPITLGLLGDIRWERTLSSRLRIQGKYFVTPNTGLSSPPLSRPASATMSTCLPISPTS